MKDFNKVSIDGPLWTRVKGILRCTTCGLGNLLGQFLIFSGVADCSKAKIIELDQSAGVRRLYVFFLCENHLVFEDPYSRIERKWLQGHHQYVFRA